MQPNQKPLSSLLIGLISLLGAALIFASAFAVGLSAFFPLMEGKRILASGTILGLSFGFEALLLFAAAFFCLQKYLERPQADTRHATVGLVVDPQVFPVVATVGLAQHGMMRISPGRSARHQTFVGFRTRIIGVTKTGTGFEDRDLLDKTT